MALFELNGVDVRLVKVFSPILKPCKKCLVLPCCKMNSSECNILFKHENRIKKGFVYYYNLWWFTHIPTSLLLILDTLFWNKNPIITFIQSSIWGKYYYPFTAIMLSIYAIAFIQFITEKYKQRKVLAEWWKHGRHA